MSVTRISWLNLSEFYKNLNFLSLLLIVFSLPFSIKLNSFFIISFTITSLIILIKDKVNISFSWPYYIPILFYSILILSYFNSYSHKIWVSDIETEVALLVFPLTFSFTRNTFSKEKINLILNVFVSATLLCCLYAHIIVLREMIGNGVSIANSFEWNYSYIELTRPTSIDPIYLSLYINFSIFILIQVSANTKRIGVIVLVVALVAYFIFFLFLLSSRIGLITFILALSAQLIFHIRKRISIMWLVGAIVIIGIMVFYVSKVPLASERFRPILTDLQLVFDNDASKKIYDNRVVIYRCSFSILSNGISIMGLGPGNDIIRMNKCYNINGFENLTNFNPHNEYISVLLRYGILGFIFFVLLMITPLFISIKTNNLLLNVISLLMIFTSLVESTFSRQKGVVFYALFYSLLIMYSDIDSSQSKQVNEGH